MAQVFVALLRSSSSTVVLGVVVALAFLLVLVPAVAFVLVVVGTASYSSYTLGFGVLVATENHTIWDSTKS